MKTTKQLYKDLQDRLPRWVIGGLSKEYLSDNGSLYGDESLLGDSTLFGQSLDVSTRIDPVYGPFCLALDDFYQWFDQMIAQTLIGQADSSYLDIHAKERGKPRLPVEGDQALRIRLTKFQDCVTEKALFEIACDTLGLSDEEKDQVDVFTLRNRLIYWNKSFWNADTTAARNRLGSSVLVKDDNNPFGVTVVIVPPQETRIDTAWKRFHWQHATWGGRLPHRNKYARLRQNLNRYKAAGTKVNIQIKETGV